MQQESGKSFWLPHGKAPASGLEAMAASIYQFHMHASSKSDNFKLDTKVAGAEWWVQVRGADMEEGDAIGFHWDRDEVLADNTPPELKHPSVATVTYLTGYGAPTVVINQTPIVPAIPPNGKPMEVLANTGVVSYPKVGKHIGFDGRLLHGVPPEAMAEVPNSEGLERITFLVNLWLTHELAEIERFPTNQLDKLKVPVNKVIELFPWSTCCSTATSLTPSQTTEAVALPSFTNCKSMKCDDFQVCGFAFGRSGDEEHQLWMPIPELDVTQGESANLIFGSQPAKIIRLPTNMEGDGGQGSKKKRKRKKKKK